MRELIDRQEVIEHIGDCLDVNGYVDTTKFAKCMREILNMPYETDEGIRANTIDECKEVLKQHWLHGTVAYRIINEICNSLEQLKWHNKR